MPSKEIVNQFISRVEENDHDNVITEFYHINASMQENNDEPKIGRDLLVENEKKVLAKAKLLTSKCIRPVFINDDYVVIQWKFSFTWKDGTQTTIEEIAHQLWKNNRIIKEKFFYDPIQKIPKQIS